KGNLFGTLVLAESDEGDGGAGVAAIGLGDLEHRAIPTRPACECRNAQISHISGRSRNERNPVFKGNNGLWISDGLRSGSGPLSVPDNGNRWKPLVSLAGRASCSCFVHLCVSEGRFVTSGPRARLARRRLDSVYAARPATRPRSRRSL